MLRVFADESDPGNKHSGFQVVAGYVGLTQQWDAFSIEWQAVIESHPSFSKVGFFKTGFLSDEKLRAEYEVTRHEADELHQSLVAVIRKWHQAYSAIACLSCEDHNEIIGPGPYSADKRFSDPFHYAFHVFVEIAVKKALKLGLEGPMHFVFDQNTRTTERALEMFNFLKSNPEHSWGFKNYLGTAEARDDRKCPPLQAADLLASAVRRFIEKPECAHRGGQLCAIDGSRSDQCVWCRLNRDQLQPFTEEWSRRATKGGAEFDH